MYEEKTPEVEEKEVVAETAVEVPEVPAVGPKPKKTRAKKVVEVAEEVVSLKKRELIGSKRVLSAEFVDGMVHAKDEVGSGFKFTVDQWNSGSHLS